MNNIKIKTAIITRDAEQEKNKKECDNVNNLNTSPPKTTKLCFTGLKFHYKLNNKKFNNLEKYLYYIV